MARRAKQRVNVEQRLPPLYEGPEVLTALLERAGCKLTATEVTEHFRESLGAGHERSDAIPALFQTEPRFGAQEDARRLYGNLFGLWAELQAVGASSGAGSRREEPAAEAPAVPERGSVAGDELPPGLVEAVWKRLSALPERETRRLRDRFEHAQPDLVSWLDAQPLPESGALAAQDLAFETWCMYDVAFGDRVRAVSFAGVRALEAEPPPMETTQPALAAYAAESFDMVAEEDAGFSPADRAQVERALATVAAALRDAVEEEE